MIKNIGILVIGLLAGAFLMNVYTNQQNKVINKELISSEIDANHHKANSNLSFDGSDINSVNTKELQEKVASLTAELELVKTSTLKSQKRVEKIAPENSDAISKELTEDEYSNAMMELFEKLNKPNAEEERLGSVALEALKRNQPSELKDLFSEDPDQKDSLNTQIENKYKKHLSQEKDINWAYEAESVLMNYFKSTQNSNFTAYRIDCRTRSCEVAGLITFEKEINPEEPMELALVSRTPSFGRITKNLRKQEFYGRYFSTQNHEMFNPIALTSKIVPYSFFLPRAK